MFMCVLLKWNVPQPPGIIRTNLHAELVTRSGFLLRGDFSFRKRKHSWPPLAHQPPFLNHALDLNNMGLFKNCHSFEQASLTLATLHSLVLYSVAFEYSASCSKASS